MGIEVVGVHKRFGSVVAVRDLRLHAQPGELLAIVGPSGCGKTTLLRVIAGLEQADAGRVVIGGRDATHLPPEKRNVGFVFQQFALFPNMNVAENIGYGLRRRRVNRQERERRVAELLAMIEMEGYDRRRPDQLSAGQQQRVALARALAPEPRTLLLDEPLSALDAAIRYQLRDELRRVQRRVGITTIMVTHDQEEALAIADRVAVMNEGCLEQVGTPWELYDRPRTHFVARFVGRGNFLQGEWHPEGVLLQGFGVWRAAARSGAASAEHIAPAAEPGSTGTSSASGTASTCGSPSTFGSPSTSEPTSPPGRTSSSEPTSVPERTSTSGRISSSGSSSTPGPRSGLGPVTVLVRPESITIAELPPGPSAARDRDTVAQDRAFVIRAIVRDIVFAGERAHVRLQLVANGHGPGAGDAPPLHSPAADGGGAEVVIGRAADTGADGMPLVLTAVIPGGDVPRIAGRVGEQVTVVIPHDALRLLPD